MDIRDNIKDFIKGVKGQEKIKVVTINGLWGTGKTYFWQEAIEKERKERNNILYKIKKFFTSCTTNKSEEIEHYSYVSLFHIKNIDDLKTAIFENRVKKKDIGKERNKLSNIKENEYLSNTKNIRNLLIYSFVILLILVSPILVKQFLPENPLLRIMQYIEGTSFNEIVEVLYKQYIWFVSIFIFCFILVFIFLVTRGYKHFGLNIPYLTFIDIPYLNIAYASLDKTLICLDDFERTKIDIQDFLGLISDLKEQRNCKIAIILNKDELPEDEAYKKFTDKVIDKDIQFPRTPKEACDIVFEENSKEAQAIVDIIKKACNKFGIINIRIIEKIKYFLLDELAGKQKFFDKIKEKIDKEKFDQEKLSSEEFYKLFLEQYIFSSVLCIYSFYIQNNDKIPSFEYLKYLKASASIEEYVRIYNKEKENIDRNKLISFGDVISKNYDIPEEYKYDQEYLIVSNGKTKYYTEEQKLKTLTGKKEFKTLMTSSFLPPNFLFLPNMIIFDYLEGRNYSLEVERVLNNFPSDEWKYYRFYEICHNILKGSKLLTKKENAIKEIEEVKNALGLIFKLNDNDNESFAVCGDIFLVVVSRYSDNADISEEAWKAIDFAAKNIKNENFFSIRQKMKDPRFLRSQFRHNHELFIDTKYIRKLNKTLNDELEEKKHLNSLQSFEEIWMNCRASQGSQYITQAAIKKLADSLDSFTKDVFLKLQDNFMYDLYHGNYRVLEGNAYIHELPEYNKIRQKIDEIIEELEKDGYIGKSRIKSSSISPLE